MSCLPVCPWAAPCPWEEEGSVARAAATTNTTNATLSHLAISLVTGHWSLTPPPQPSWRLASLKRVVWRLAPGCVLRGVSSARPTRKYARAVPLPPSPPACCHQHPGALCSLLVEDVVVTWCMVWC